MRLSMRQLRPYVAELLTCDAHFEALPKLIYIQKIIA